MLKGAHVARRTASSRFINLPPEGVGRAKTVGAVKREKRKRGLLKCILFDVRPTL